MRKKNLKTKEKINEKSYFQNLINLFNERPEFVFYFLSSCAILWAAICTIVNYLYRFNCSLTYNIPSQYFSYDILYPTIILIFIICFYIIPLFCKNDYTMVKFLFIFTNLIFDFFIFSYFFIIKNIMWIRIILVIAFLIILLGFFIT